MGPPAADAVSWYGGSSRAEGRREVGMHIEIYARRPSLMQTRSPSIGTEMRTPTNRSDNYASA